MSKIPKDSDFKYLSKYSLSRHLDQSRVYLIEVGASFSKGGISSPDVAIQ